MKLAITAAAVASLVAASAASAQIAYWAFPATAPTQNYQISFPLAADQKANAGAAVITTNALTWTGGAPVDSVAQGSFQYFAGSTLNALPGFTAGQGLSLRGNTNNDSNGKSMTLQFDTTGFSDIVLSYAERVTSTGANSIAFSYSTDGTNFTPFTTVAPTRNSTYSVRTVDFSSVPALNNLAAAYIRMEFTGFSSAAGAVRFDNIQVVPTPGAAALLGLGGLAAFRRRR
jgi:hypothetical protein